jgi:hypothetical protein
MGIEFLKFLRTSPTIPFAMMTAMLAVLIFWICRRPPRDPIGDFFRFARIAALIVLWMLGFYKLFVQP